MSAPDEKRITHTLEALTQSKIELMKGFVRTEKRVSQVLHVVSGTAWITMDGEDTILNPGDALKLSHGKYKAVVSAAGGEPLVYEFEA
jgi:mannose-6-phosphate isomerase-like protein (cupin superfamily)